MSNETIRVVVQARMRSGRLPGKVLAELAGRPMLAFVVGRLLAARPDLRVLVATSTSRADDDIEDFCGRLGVGCFRGPETDVLGRYLAATADMADDDVVVRATADNPLYCPRRTAAVIAHHRQLSADYTCIENLSYVVPEVMRAAALRAMGSVASDARCREHVTPYFREQPHAFRVVTLPATWHGLRPEIRLTVDTAEELDRMAAVCRKLAPQGLLFSLEDVYSLFDASGRMKRYNCTDHEDTK